MKHHLAESASEQGVISGKSKPSKKKNTMDSSGKASVLGDKFYRNMFENMAQGCAIHEIILDEYGKPCDYRFLEINPAFENLTGLKRDNVIGKLATEVLPGLEFFWIETYGQVALTGHPVQFDHFTRAINRYFRVYAYSAGHLTFTTIFIDITDQKLVERQLNEVAEKYFTMFNATSDGVFIHDLDGRILEVNDAYCQMSGYSREELIYMPISLLEASESSEEIKDHIQKIINQEGHDRFESIHRCKDGSLFDVDVTALYFDLESSRIAIFVRDITTRKKAEKRLAYLASFPDRNPNPISEVDMQGRVHYNNETALNLFPDLAEMGITHAWFADWEPTVLPFRQGSQDMIVRDVMVGDKWFQQSLSHILTDGLVRIYGTDITERKRVEAAIRLSEEKYRTIVETSAEGISLISLDGVYIYLNQRMADMLGYTVDEIQGKATMDFLTEDMKNQIQPSKNQWQNGEPVNGEFKFLRSDGSILYTIYNSAPIFNDVGEHIGSIVMHMDITKRKQAEEALRASERQLNRAEEISHLGSWELDLTTNNLTWSDEVYRLFGYQPGEFPATYQGFLDAIHPEDRSMVDAAYSNSIRDGHDSYEIEHRLIDHSTGVVRYVHEKCVHFRDESGNVIRSEGMVHDITDQRAADLALRHARDELELHVKERTQALYETNEQLTSEVFQHKKTQADLEAAVRELKITEDELRKNNELLINAQKVLDTERLRYHDLFDFAPDGYLVTDIHGHILDVNHSASSLLNSPKKNLVGKSLTAFVDHADHYRLSYLLNKLQKNHGPQTREFRFIPKGVPLITAMVMVASAKDETGKDTLRWNIHDITQGKRTEEIIRQNSIRNAVLSEVSKKLVEASLDETAILNVVAESIARLVGDACVIAIATPDGKQLNPAAWFHRRPESEDLLTSRLTSESQKIVDEPSWQVYQSSQPLLIQDTSAPSNNEITLDDLQQYLMKVGVTSLIIIPLQIGGQSIGILRVSRDSGGQPYTSEDKAFLEILASRITQSIHNARLYQELQNALQNEQETHNQLVQSEKFAAVGRLLASITHEINNPLQTIKNCLYLISQDAEEGDSAISDYLKMASAETDRLSSLVAQLREVYRPPAHSQKVPVVLFSMVGEVQSLLAGYLQEKHVSWVVNPPGDEISTKVIVEAMPDQIKQVFLNIALNAIDAMEPLGGTITITMKMSADFTQAGVCFTDNGPGLPDEVKERLFEPFNTTKEKGLGLGLSICFDIIKKHSGYIEAESEPGAGASFTVWLPLRAEEE